tara:strand:- start:186 stop:653 length:468 start_codon:yes stop_codon:yes gene_type:complete
MKKISKLNFKKTLGKFATGVTVICTNDYNQIYGITVNSFSSLSLTPPLVLFSLGKNSSSIKSFLKSKYLSINILSNKQENISNHFAVNNHPNDNIDFFYSKKNTPLIYDCIANLECKLIESFKKGDHHIFICKLINTQHNDKKKPLLYFKSKYIK